MGEEGKRKVRERKRVLGKVTGGGGGTMEKRRRKPTKREEQERDYEEELYS